jgi:hypothetical protein
LARLGIHGRRPGRRLSGVDLPRRHSAARAARGGDPKSRAVTLALPKLADLGVTKMQSSRAGMGLSPLVALGRHLCPLFHSLDRGEWRETRGMLSRWQPILAACSVAGCLASRRLLQPLNAYGGPLAPCTQAFPIGLVSRYAFRHVFAMRRSHHTAGSPQLTRRLRTCDGTSPSHAWR